MSNDKKIAVVTGGNRGIGFEVCQELAEMGFKVILTARNRQKGIEATQELRLKGLDVLFYNLDVTDLSQIEALEAFVRENFGHIDALVNNAGVMLDRPTDSMEQSLKKIHETMENNVYGPLMVCRTFVDLMEENNYGRIVNVSSGMGQLNLIGSGYPAYRLSKTGINVVTKIIADETQYYNIKVNSVCPGWIRTDMGGYRSTRSVEKGAETIVWLATLPEDGETGLFFRDMEVIPW